MQLQRLLLPAVWISSSLAFAADARESRTFTVEDMLGLQRISDVQASPDGKLVAFVVSRPDLEKNSSTSHIWIASLDGGAPRQLTNHEKGESAPCWSPDSKEIAFLSARGGSSQIWRIRIDGGEARQVTKISTGAGAPRWSPAGSLLAFTSSVVPGIDGGDEAQKKHDEAAAASGIKARVLDHLFYRHWSDWRDGKRQHLFVVPADGGEAKDLTPGDIEVLDGRAGFAFSPDGKEVAYVRGPVSKATGSGADIEAWSTDSAILVVAAEDGSSTCLTEANVGWDGSPAWSPDGRHIAFRSQARDGYEADRFRLAVVERATAKANYDLLPTPSLSVAELVWAPDSKAIYVGVDRQGEAVVFALPVSGLTGDMDGLRQVTAPPHFTGLSMPADGSALVGACQSLARPVDVAVVRLPAEKGVPTAITHFNEDLLSRRDMPAVESIEYEGALGEKIQAWILKPPGPARKHPLLLFIHGGPQGAWEDSFHYRWNAAVFASAGFLLMLPNPHGSTGFGQAFTEQISGDWGGACYEDLMKGVDWAISKGLVDRDRLAAMGGSFGGYMVNWILGHTDRFKALISHAGVYNLESMYGTTEELWFPEWDFRGPPWKSVGQYEKFSPHRFAANFKTPTLVIHGELDFRVPVSEGMQLFTALRRQGVEARFLYFPDEGHWIAKPKNSKLWYETALQWLERHVRG